MEVISKIERFGYPRRFIDSSLKANVLNYATTSYYLFTLS